MTAKKRTTKEEVVMPIPVTPGPVEPPKARPTWWIWVLIGVFIGATLLALILTILKWWPASTPGNREPGTGIREQAEEAAEEVEEAPTTYSYLSVVKEVKQEDHYAGTPGECFDAELNIEAPAVEAPKTVAEKTSLVLNIIADDAARLGRFVDLANKHRLKLTLHFPTTVASSAVEMTAWGKQGHEIGMYFDPEVEFGVDEQTETSSIPYGSWLLAMHKTQQAIEDLCSCQVVSWMNGSEFDRIFDVAHDLDLVVNTDQTGIAAVNPWTPEAGGSVEALTAFDPLGQVVYLPSGVYPAQCEAPDQVAAPFSSVSLSFVSKALYETMESVVPGRINVFRATVRLSDFGDPLDDDAEFDAWQSWLATVIDPQIRSGRLVPARSIDVADAYFTWLDLNLQNIEFVK